jgi:hypothetical protein
MVDLRRIGRDGKKIYLHPVKIHGKNRSGNEILGDNRTSAPERAEKQ